MSTDTPHRQLKERLRQERAELILEIAEVMFIDKGYHDTSMDEIAARAGVAKGTLYQHFPGKEDLVFALFERHLERFERMIEQIAASTETASAKLERILRYAYLEQHGMRTQSLQFLYRNR
ncbi:MAG: helix-turn-helix transcriptional regulator, partial [Ktedonobacteraceae bacterium]|nr:helix-turn-helix transcriptional regulator [Ktedonobacteraceae bacterium]